MGGPMALCVLWFYPSSARDSSSLDVDVVH